MIANYRPPRLLIEQLLEIISAPGEADLIPIVIGPSYFLETFDTQRQTGVEFEASGFNIPYLHTPATGAPTALSSTAVVDQDTVVVWGSKLDAELLELTNTATAEYVKLRNNSLSNASVLQLYDFTAPQAGDNLTSAISAAGSATYVSEDGVPTSGGAGTGLTVDVVAGNIPSFVGVLPSAAGSGYSDATGVSVTTDGAGSGLTVDITTSLGAVSDITVNTPGSGYAVGDTITVTGGNGDATYLLDENDLTPSVVTSVTVASAGSGYQEGDVISILGTGSSGDCQVTLAFEAASASDFAVRDGFSKASLISGLAGRSTQVGDVVYIPDSDGSGTPRRRHVVELIGRSIPDSFGTDASSSNQTPDNDVYNVQDTTSGVPVIDNITFQAKLQGAVGVSDTEHGFHGLSGAQLVTEYGDRFTLTCVSAGDGANARVAITSASGQFSNSSLQSTGSGQNFVFDDFGSSRGLAGLVISFTLSGAFVLSVGDTLTFTYKGDYSKLTTGAPGASANLVLSSSSYSGNIDTTYLLEVVKSVKVNDLVRITDTTVSGAPIQDNALVEASSNNERYRVLKGAAVGVNGTFYLQPLGDIGTDDVSIANSETLTVVGGSGVLTVGAAGGGGEGSGAVLGFGDGLNQQLSSVVRVTDTEGVDITEEVLVQDGVLQPLGTKGLQFQFTYTNATLEQGGLKVGEVYYVRAVAAKASTDRFDKIRLNGPAVDTAFWDASDKLGISLRIGEITKVIEQTESPAGTDVYTTNPNPNGVSVGATLLYQETGRDPAQSWIPYVDGVGKFYIEYRALKKPGVNQGPIAITSPQDINDLIGPIDLRNDLAYGAFRMWVGSGGSTIFALPVSEDSVTGFSEAIVKIEKTDKYYALAILTDKQDVRELAQSHVEAMSQADIKNFRRAYTATESPGSYPILTERPNGSKTKATITDLNGQNLLITSVTEDINFLTIGVAPGDRFILPNEGIEYTIASVVSASEAILESGPASPNGIGTTFEIWKPDTPETQADFVIRASTQINSRRVSNIWTDRPVALIDGVVTQIPVRYLAAEIAGARSALLPQQGMTRTAVTTVSDAPSMFTQYSNSLLNKIASHGVWIVTQEVEGGEVFVRHQLTTKVDSGPLYWEDNIGVNIDEISLAIKHRIESLIGKRTISRITLGDIRDETATILNRRLSVSNSSLREIGPQINAWDNLRVTVDPVLKDRVNVSADVYVGLPMNEIKFTLNAFADVPELTL